MGDAFLRNRIVRLGGGFPDFSFTGNSIVLDTGAESGNWQIALTSSGTLTLNKPAGKVTIFAQGAGGGGGAGSASAIGSDGADGAIASAEEKLSAGAYAIIIGAGGSAGLNGAGGAGGASSFSDLLSASGGAGGARNGGAVLEHNGLYSTCGQGGAGGAKAQYTGTVTQRDYQLGNNHIGESIYASDSKSSSVIGTMQAGVKYYIVAGSFHKNSDGFWQKLEIGGWVNNANVSHETVSDTRKWYGNPGYSGVILLGGKA